jgi:uncharacterized protein (DUF952 family)
VSALFHIVDRDEWAAAEARGVYRPASLDTDGFVHFSFAHQVRATAALHYPDVPNLVVVEIDPTRVEAELRVEDTYGSGTEFPHVYGPIPTAAAVRTYELSDPTFSAAGPAATDR